MANKVRDLRRKRFGRLVAIKRQYDQDTKQSLWLCVCDCGNKKWVSRKHLLSGRTNSCGCLASEITSERSWKGCGEISGVYWYDLCRNAKYRDISVEITIEEAWQLFLDQDGCCYYTGEPLTFYKRRKKDAKIQTASLERVDNNKGYSKDNCRWVHKVVNRLKNDFSFDELMLWCRKLVDYDRKNPTPSCS